MLFHNSLSVVSSQTWPSPPDPSIRHQSQLSYVERSWTEEEISSCLWKWGELPDFLGKSWAHCHPSEMFSCFLFPLFLSHISNLPSSPFVLWWGWRHQVQAAECLKEVLENGCSRHFWPRFPKSTLLPHSAILSGLQAPGPTSPCQPWIVVGAQCGEEQKVWRASPNPAWFPASASSAGVQGQVLFGRSPVPNVDYRWN